MTQPVTVSESLSHEQLCAEKKKRNTSAMTGFEGGADLELANRLGVRIELVARGGWARALLRVRHRNGAPRRWRACGLVSRRKISFCERHGV